MSRLVRLRDEQWRRIECLLPAQRLTGGRPAKPHRPLVEAMIWILRTGAPWRDLPGTYGPWQTVYTRFSRWSKSGVLERLLDGLAAEHDGEGFLIDATIVRAHQDASGARKRGVRSTSGALAADRRPSSTRLSMRSAIPCGSSSLRDSGTR